jgi:hypothetical protein
MEGMMGNELSPNNMYACPQLDTCHVGSYFGPLVQTICMHVPNLTLVMLEATLAHLSPSLELRIE